MEDINLYEVLPLSFGFLVIWVSAYVFMMLNVMRADPQEITFREDSGLENKLLP